MFGVEVHIRIGMFHLDERNLDSEPLPEALPGPTAPLTPPPKLAQPLSQHIFPERPQPVLVARDGVVLEIPPHHRLQPLQGDLDRLVAALAQLRLDFSQLGCHALPDGLSLDREVARLVARPTHVSETQKVEGLRLPLATLLPALGGVAPKLDQARLLRVQFQPELP